ncbi:phospholipid carrier-dependent glycosyltransferase [Methylibium sp.]|uniref:phospholipid carrier-dependent glycosyltransferase n=1 Tax=Methylibium sp. TaxID=2067992 RepID=UPI003D121ECA
MASIPSDPSGSRRQGLLVAALSIVWWVWSLGLRPISLPDEGRYAGVARDMLAHGDWLVPRLNGLPFFHKPPLFYWIDALAMGAFGVGPVAARTASAFGALLACAALAWHARRLAGPRFALAALAALSLQPLFFFGGQFANLDMLVAGCITATVVAWAHGLAAPDGEGRTALRIGWAAAACGVLAKGLIGWVLPALVVLPWALVMLERPRLRTLMRWADPLGVLLTLAIALPWFVLVARAHPGFLDYFVLEQHVRRYATAHFNNRQPPWFYVAVLALGALPWTLALAGLRGAWRAAEAAQRRWLVLWAWWALAIVLFFSLPRSKLVGYVLPVLPPLALLVAWVLMHRVRGPRWERIAAALGVILCLGGLWGARQFDRKALRSIPIEVETMLQADPAWRDAQPVYIDSPRSEIALRAPLSHLPWIVSDWDDPAIAAGDSWRKELTDGARFDPDTGARLLLRPAQLPARLAEVERAWIVANAAWQPPPGSHGSFEPVLREREVQLWRWRRGPEGP